MSYQPPRSPHLQMMGGAALSSGRSAALLIDFDNVTMNVRSDLGKELKTLLDSEMFRGKIAVRRAYADWRRYPASVVPLTEASVDLIFAPAYGTSKKNATDLRMAVDAIELAFMRPEIGVFILLTGDSDFSSCVMKLKEYGKYVIGVGMRESASDLLIQNCDEYYSYHNLSGLTRATEDTGVREDPWALVAKAAQTMARRGDVMRVDRLKQVMIELDPGFSEKDIGYSKFSKFIQEAKDRGMLRLRRTDGGEWEVAPSDREEAPAAEETQYSSDRPERLERGERWRDRDRGRGRGGRDRFRGRDRDRDRPRYPEALPAAGEPSADAEPELETPAFEAPAPPVSAQPEVVEAAAPSAPAAEAPAPVQAAAEPAAPVDPLQNAFALLQHTVRQMVRRPGETARDGDVKRRMLEAQPGFDEHAFGFSKFSRFLREAHERQVVDVRRQDDGGYEVLLPSSGGIRLPAPVLTAGGAAATSSAAAESAASSSESAPPAQETAAPRGGRGGRGRGRRGEPAGAPPLIPGQVVGGTAEAQPVAETPVVEAREPELTPAQALQERQDGDALVGHREPAVATARIEDPASIANRGSSTSAGSVGLRGRGGRGRRGGEPSGPPPLLPGQVVSVGGARAPEPVAETPVEADVVAEAPAVEASNETPAVETRGGRSRRGRGREAASTSTEAPSSDVVETPALESAAAPAAGIDAARLGLPTDRDGIVQRVSSYNFVGRATGEALVDAYGENVWRTLDESPDAVRELLGARKARPLLEQWAAERDQLIANAPAPAEPEAPAEPVAEAPLPVEATEGDTEAAADAAEAPRGRSRGRRGRGRGRTSSDETSSAQADAVIGDTDPSRVGAAGTGDLPAGDDQPSAAAQAEEVLGDTDPTLVGDLDGEGEAAPRGRTRSRRGGRGRGRGGRGDAAADAAPAEASAPEPTPTPEPVAEAAPAEERPAGRGRGRGRGRGGQAAEAAAPAEASAPAPEPVAEAAPAAEASPAGRGRSRGGRGRGAAADPAAPAPEPTPVVTPEATSGGRGRSRRGGNAAAAEAPPATPAPAPADASSSEEGGGRSRSRRRGGRGRGRGRAGGTPGEG